jgi:hypothetical protein
MCLHWALDVMFFSVRSSVAYNSFRQTLGIRDTTIDYKL